MNPVNRDVYMDKYPIGSKWKTVAMGIVTITGYEHDRIWNGTHVPVKGLTENNTEINYTDTGLPYDFNRSNDFKIIGPEPKPDAWKENYPIGSVWKSEMGTKLVVVDHTNDLETPLMVYSNAGRDVFGFTREGTHTGRMTSSHTTRLVEPWTEPKTGTFWVNIYERDNRVHDTRISADQMGTANRLACVEVNWTEGQGLDK